MTNGHAAAEAHEGSPEKIKLTKAAVDRLEAAPDSQIFVWDTEVRGLGVRVSPGGTKTFILQRRTKGGQERRISLRPGRRHAAAGRTEDGRASLPPSSPDGLDPVRERKRAERARLTLRQAFQQYIKAPVKKGGGKGMAKKPRTDRDIEKHMEYFADWLDLPVTDIKPSMVNQRHWDPVARSPAQGNLAMRYLRATLNHTIADTDDDDVPVLPANPVAKLNKTNSWASTPARKRHLWRNKIAHGSTLFSTGSSVSSTSASSATR